jgi:glyoxylase-like metal-dependent hydrolase (beta-lactamase superfamily II)
MDVRIISIGTLAANPLWGEKAGTAARTGHATTTLIRSGKRVILVDPGLPEAVVAARLGERANVSPGEVTHVFLTCFKPEMRRGLAGERGLFDHATWWISEAEREGVGVPLVRRLQEAAQQGDAELAAVLQRDVAILKRCEAAPDRLADHADLFPLPGVTPGLSGVLVDRPPPWLGSSSTLLVCGDAVATVEHLERGMVLHGAVDVERARESFREAIEIADVLIPGRDDVAINPVRRGF